jgi:hypothetical protein
MKLYTIVTWNNIQELLDYDWFESECHLINDEVGLEKYGSFAYFVPIERLKENYSSCRYEHRG